MPTPDHLGTPATQVLERAAVHYQVHRYEHDPRAQSFGMEAAERLGRPPEQLFKTLLVVAEGKLAVGIVPVHRRLDLKALARALHVKKCQLAEPERAEKATGYVVGGISPLGQRTALPMVLDASAQTLDTMLVSAGMRGADVELRPHDLIRLTGARVVPIAQS